ncbi:UNVERIFIED_CONTAM: hypothetical protein FKN15_023472 [Acipenser sinensis]
MRPLQLWFSRTVCQLVLKRNRLLTVSNHCLQALSWWKQPAHLCLGIALGSVTSREIITTDASNSDTVGTSHHARCQEREENPSLLPQLLSKRTSRISLKEAGLLDHINFSHSVGKEAQPPKKIRKVKEERKKRGVSKPQKEKKNLPMKKTWPEKRKERRLKSKKKKSVQVIEEDFPRGPKMPSPRAYSHSKKKFAKAALFSHMKNQGDEFNEKQKKPKVKGKRKKRGSSHDDSFAVDDSLFLIKQRNKNRKR